MAVEIYTDLTKEQIDQIDLHYATVRHLGSTRHGIVFGFRAPPRGPNPYGRLARFAAWFAFLLPVSKWSEWGWCVERAHTHQCRSCGLEYGCSIAMCSSHDVSCRAVDGHSCEAARIRRIRGLTRVSSSCRS